MRNITQRCAEELLLSILKEDLKNCEDTLADWKAVSYDPTGYVRKGTKSAKKDIKTLKRAINFYSVEPPYDEV